MADDLDELLGMLQGTRLSDRGPLFPGSSCYPLSPERRNTGGGRRARTHGQHDQLEVIFDVLGTPSDEEIKSLASEDARRYVREFKKREGCGIAEKLPYVGEDVLAFLTQILQFTPSKRIGVDQALENGLVRDLRRPDANAKPCQVELKFEKGKDLGETLLRKYFEEELRKFHR